MRFKTNCGQRGMERPIQARAKQSEKLEKLREKSEPRKPELDGAPLYRKDDDPGMETSIQPADSIARPFDYQAAAELFLAKRSGGLRSPLRYRRFASAAEAIQFAIEEVPSARNSATHMQVGEFRFDADGIRSLYERRDYPLQRAQAAPKTTA